MNRLRHRGSWPCGYLAEVLYNTTWGYGHHDTVIDGREGAISGPGSDNDVIKHLRPVGRRRRTLNQFDLQNKVAPDNLVGTASRITDVC